MIINRYAGHAKYVMLGRQRGALLLEAILALTIAASLIGVAAVILDQESKRQEETITAASLKDLTLASRSYVGENYDDLLIDLHNEAKTSGEALMTVSMATLADEGYVPAALLNGGTITNLFEQEYSLLMRAVNRNDSGSPQATMTNADIDPSGTGTINPELTDDDPSNGEMEIESILVSAGGEDIPGVRGGPMVSKTQIPTVGLVLLPGQASGSYGNFTLDISSFEDLAPQYPTPGHFAAIVSLSRFGVLSSSGSSTGGDVDISRALLRCADIDPVLNAVAYNECIDNTNNEVFSSIIMRSWVDRDGITRNPGIRGLTNVSCDENAPIGAVNANELLIDCSSTRLNGDAAIAGDLIVGTLGNNVTISQNDITLGNVQVTGDGVNIGGVDALANVANPAGGEELRLNADRAVIGGKDLNSYLYETQITPVQTDITKQICPIDDTGVQLVPRIYSTPAAYADARGRELAGVRAFVQDNGTSWRTRMISFVQDDFCKSTDNSTPPRIIPLDPSGSFHPNGAPNQPNCSTFNPDGTVATDLSDGLVDAYELSSSFGAVQVQTRCEKP